VAIAVYLVVLVAAFFFFIVRPQRRQAAARRALLQTLQPGDEIITSGGIYGTVRGLDEDAVQVEIADGLVVRVARGAIAARVGPAGHHGVEEVDGPDADEAR
jgi:preprotein translocase subunit YajC